MSCRVVRCGMEEGRAGTGDGRTRGRKSLADGRIGERVGAAELNSRAQWGRCGGAAGEARRGLRIQVWLPAWLCWCVGAGVVWSRCLCCVAPRSKANGAERTNANGALKHTHNDEQTRRQQRMKEQQSNTVGLSIGQGAADGQVTQFSAPLACAFSRRPLLVAPRASSAEQH